jgi:hypothetical protein
MMRDRSRPFGKDLLAVLGLLPLAVGPLVIILAGTTEFRGVAPAFAQSRDPIVTSDTPEYCGVLMDRITGMTHTNTEPLPTEATLLSAEGEKMCVHGQTRGGIMRLRRAIAIMQQHGED